MAELYDVKRNDDRRVLTRGSLELFARFYFPHILTSEPAPFHITEFNRFLPGEKVPCPNRILEIWPRDHGKSQLFSVIKNLWEVTTDPYNIGFKNIDKMLVSNTMTLTEKWMRIIESELAGNVRIIADWGDLLKKAKINNVGEKVLANGARIYARAYGSQVRGEHPSGVDIDDLEDRVDAQNPDLRKKMYEFFTQDLYGTLSPDCKMFMVGTIVHEEGLLNTLWNDDVMTEGWTKIKYSAITDDGKALWPSRWSLERLEQRRREVGELAFSQEYLNLPLPSENPTIRPEWIQYIDSIPNKGDMICFTALDPAFSEKRTNDYSAVVTVGVVHSGDKKGKIYVCERNRGHWSPQDSARAFFDQVDVWKSQTCIYEGYGAGGASIKFDLDREMARRNRHYNLKKHADKKVFSGGKWIVADKVARAASVASLLENGYVYFQKDQRDLVNEFLLLPNGKNDDMADALVHALMELKNGYIRNRDNQPRRSTKVLEHVDAVAGY